MEGMGEEKLYFLLLKSVKRKKAQCLNSFCRRLWSNICVRNMGRDNVSKVINEIVRGKKLQNKFMHAYYGPLSFRDGLLNNSNSNSL